MIDRPTVRKATAGEIGDLAKVLGHAFDDDPLAKWMFPNPSLRQARLPRMFVTLLKAALPFGEVYTNSTVDSVAIWNPPGTFPMGWRVDTVVGLRTVSLLGTRFPSCARGLAYFARHHPKEPHWYLQMIGTEPNSQGKGYGSSMLEAVLARCDSSKERIYLEASKEENVPFYVRHGFDVEEEVQVPGGPKVWAMWRDPREP